MGSNDESVWLGKINPQVLYRVAIKKQFWVAAGFRLRLHRRDACATNLLRNGIRGSQPVPEGSEHLSIPPPKGDYTAPLGAETWS